MFEFSSVIDLLLERSPGREMVVEVVVVGKSLKMLYSFEYGLGRNDGGGNRCLKVLVVVMLKSLGDALVVVVVVAR